MNMMDPKARPNLAVQKGGGDARLAGINPNYWYPVAWAREVKIQQILPVQIWEQEIAIYRDKDDHLHALEDACLHKGVALHLGEVQGDRLVCAYHGWEFDGSGKCVSIPYLKDNTKCPKSRIRHFPVQEAYGIIWIFPGDPDQADSVSLPAVPEYKDADWFMVEIPAYFKAHFSLCNENTMDVFHGHLHKGLQGWYDPILKNLETSDTQVRADYQVSYQGKLAKLLGLSSNDQETTKTVVINYQYPHYRSNMDSMSALYLMRLPVSPTETKSFSLMFLKPGIPKWIWYPVRKPLSRILWHLILKRFLEQDVEMVESEQDCYHRDPKKKHVEINPAIIALRRVIRKQFQLYKNALTDEVSR